MGFWISPPGQPKTFMAFNTQANWSDQKWDVLYKIVGALQNLPGADPENNPKWNDTKWDLLRKWEKAEEALNS